MRFMKTAAEIASSQLPKLTNAQMLEDFDYMTRILRDVFPAATVNKKVYGIDVFDKLLSYRKKITYETSSLEFAVVVSDALCALKGCHLWPTDMLYHFYSNEANMNLASFKSISDFVANSVPDDAIDINHQYWITLAAKKWPASPIVFFYHNGEYYTRNTFTLHGKTYPAGMKVIRVNGRVTREIIENMQDKLNLFDPEQKLCYGVFGFFNTRNIGHNFYLLMEQCSPSGWDFDFQTTDDQTVSIFIDDNEQQHSIPATKHPIIAFGKMVKYLPEPGILYLRIPAMDENDAVFYLDGIFRESTAGIIRAVILDIRGNPGGKDCVWRNILKKLISDKISFSSQLAIKHNPASEKYIRMYKKLTNEVTSSHDVYIKDIFEHPPRTVSLSYLDGEEFLLFDNAMTIEPADDSLQLNVPIYVITHNVYSAAGSLVSLAAKSDALISVGIQNPACLGEGFDPRMVALPNSKLIFSVTIALDVANCKSAFDTLHTDVKVKVPMTVKEKLDYLNSDIGADDDAHINWLQKHDPYFKKILELQNAKK